MVFTKDFVRDFYRVIQQDRVLVLVNSDVDAICAARIIQCLFTWDNVIHTIVPITGKQSLESAYLEHIEGVKYVLLINCGGSLDLVDILQPEPETVFFILDSHRPLSIENIYNAVQTRIILKQEQVNSDVPEYEDIFRDDETDSEDESGSDDEGRKRRRFDENYLEKQQEKRMWHQNRAEVMSKYMSTCYTGASAALTMYTVAFTMSLDTTDMLWWAIVGVTSQHIFHKVDHEHYFDNIGVLQDHVSRVSKRLDDTEGEYSMNSLRISFENDIMADMYRHWNIYDSLCQSIYTASHFRIWTLKGKSRFHEFLAVMGLPLTKCKQQFTSMDTALRNDVKSLLTEHCEKFNVEQTSLFIPTFVASIGYRSKVSAVDYTLVCATMLEDMAKTDHVERFLKATDCLHRTNIEIFEKGVSQAIKLQSVIMSQVQFILSTNAVTPSKSFLYTILSEGSPENIYFQSAVMLERLAHFTLEAFLSSEKCTARRKDLPLVMLCPLGADADMTLVVGIPPMDTIKNDNSRNIFGEVFKQVQHNVQCRTKHDHLDSHVIQVAKEDQEMFLEGLLLVLSA